MSVLAQTTQSLSGSMANWSPRDWAVFFAALGGFITVSIVPSIIAIIVAWRGSNRAAEANTKAVEASTKADAAQVSTGRIAEGLHQTNQTVATIAMNTIPVALQSQLDLRQASQDARAVQQDARSAQQDQKQDSTGV